jgi:ABC-type Fe3+/spermidine/putrescine transport system ATPase subunit
MNEFLNRLARAIKASDRIVWMRDGRIEKIERG